MPIRLTQVGAGGMILRISDYPRTLLEFSIFSLLDDPNSPYRAYPAALRVFECSPCAESGDPLALVNQTNLC